MLVACRLVGLSALETYYAAGRSGRAIRGRRGSAGLWLASARSGRVTAGWPDVSSVVSVPLSFYAVIYSRAMGIIGGLKSPLPFQCLMGNKVRDSQNNRCRSKGPIHPVRDASH